MVFGDIRGYILVSMLLLCTIVAHFMLQVLDVGMRVILGFLRAVPKVLTPEERISAMDLVFGTTNMGLKLNLSMFMYTFVMVYMLHSANSQYRNTNMLFPRFTGFLILFLLLISHSAVMSVMPFFPKEGAPVVTPPLGTLSAAMTAIYYNVLTFFLGIILGLIASDIIVKTNTSELIYFSPYDSYAEGCRRSSKTEFKCDLVAANDGAAPPA
jgi:hypothetical protein